MARDRGGPSRASSSCASRPSTTASTPRPWPSSPTRRSSRGPTCPSCETSTWAARGVGVAPDVSAYAVPARAEDLTSLPPAYICVSEFDPLRDEAIAYTQRLLDAGVPTELHLVPGTVHGSHAIPGPKINEPMNAESVTVIQRA
ncbi:alpha/beta hydrolase [Streptomyces sp. NBC_01314]|nr:alpha/beta hydrolase [Streptomyces sp. NBC_01314]